MIEIFIDVIVVSNRQSLLYHWVFEDVRRENGGLGLDERPMSAEGTC
jgi:hypothetical protein